jgi:histidinol dehydrogenase
MRHLEQSTEIVESDRAAVRDRVTSTLADIRRKGEPAVRRHAAELDGHSPTSFRVPHEVLAFAGERIPAKLKDAIDFAEAQVRRLAELQRSTLRDLEVETRPGVVLGHRHALEHVEVHVADPRRLMDRLGDYGSLFVGEETTVAYRDKVSGPNHILPTRRSARFTGGLWVGKFSKTVTFQYMDESASTEMARHCEVEDAAEGMVAHARTATIRIERYTRDCQ